MLASPELAAQLFQEMSPEQVQEITSEITQIPRLQNRQKIEILSQHMGVKLTPELLANPRLESDLCAAWDAFVRSDARAAVRSLEHFLRSWSKSKAYPQLRRPLDPCKKVGVIFMSLPPEKSARLFSELGPETVQRITLAITQLPTITPKWRRDVLCEFLGLDSRRHTASSAADTLEILVNANPKRCAQLLREMLD